jgi:putative membrane protein
MVSEHGDMNKEWAELADDNDMNSGVSSRGAIDLGDAGEQAVDRLEDLEGAAFDQAYMNEMIRHHEQSLAAFTQMGYSARSAEIRQLANNGLSPIRTHLALARQIGSRVGVSTTAGSAGGVIVPKPVPTTDTGRRTTAGRTTTSPTTTTPTTTGRTTTAAADNDRNDENATKPPLPPADRAFVRDVVSDHRMHIRLAKRAQREAKRDETRDLAERIERDFDKWEDRWLGLADRRDLEVSSRLERADRQKIERLDGASERGFDRTYVTMLSNHLETVLQHLRKQRNDAQSPVVRRMADSEIPQVREHLEQARKLREEAEKRAEKSDRD